MSSEGMQWYEYVNHDIKEQELEGGLKKTNYVNYLSKLFNMYNYKKPTVYSFTHIHNKYINQHHHHHHPLSYIHFH